MALIAAVIIAVPLMGARVSRAEGSGCALETAGTRGVIRVIDGDTITLDDGSELRLVGALAPRAADAGLDVENWAPERAARETLEALTLGRRVELAVAGRRNDRYGRLLAHAFVVTPAGREWLQGHMLASGHARAYVLPGNSACLSELLEHETVARESGRGLWAHAAYQVKPASSTRDLLRLRSTYQIVEGRVVKAVETGGHTFLNFGEDWKEDFTARVDPADRRALLADGFAAKSFEGRRVRVRGWIERRAGPAIQIQDTGQIELLPEDVAGEAQPRRNRRRSADRSG